MSAFDVSPAHGSHAPVLERALAALPAGAFVIEHGVGIYSSSVICRHDVRVVLVEELPGWSDWAGWLYASHGREAIRLDRAKSVREYLAESALVFIDGAARERCDLLRWSLDAEVPTIIAHDTEDDARKVYGYSSHLFEARGYTITDDGQRPTTTVWTRT